MAASNTSEWFSTEPWEPVSDRRGDPLGFRAVANFFSDVLVPDLSNRTSDARWFSLLCWSLWLSDQAPWGESGTPNEMLLNSRNGAAARYAWLRPLELLWVARTFALCKGEVQGRQLPGIRAIRRWTEAAESGTQGEHFAMSPDQWNRYRNTGIYGAYRVALRRLPGLTQLGNGWTPGPVAEELTNRVNAHLGRDANALADFSKRSRTEPEKYWLKKWTHWNSGSDRAAQMLPSDVNTIEPLHDTDERQMLAKVIYNNDRPGAERRRTVAKLAAEFEASNQNPHHPGLCGHLATALADQRDGAALAFLEPFTCFADSAMEALNAVWQQFSEQPRQAPALPLASVSMAPEVASSVQTLFETAAQWRSARTKFAGGFVPMRECDSLAENVGRVHAADVAGVLSTLIEHHLNYGGGKRWMKIEDGNILPLLPTKGLSSTPYRFRLWQVCRMAVQCGVISTMPAASLDAEIEEDDA